MARPAGPENGIAVLANLMGFGDIGVYVLQVIFFVGGVAVMIAFVRNAKEVEPFLTKR